MTVRIATKLIGPGQPCLLVAEISANHNQSYEEALRLVHAAAQAGADAVKFQTYTADTITLDVRSEIFRREGARPGEPEFLYDLYRAAYTPWEWQGPLKEVAESLGLLFFSTPFDETAVDFLEGLGVPAYKIASFELVDLPLLRRVARTGKPILLSTGMATLTEIEEAVAAIRTAGSEQIVLLKCTSAYPAAPQDMNLVTIPDMAGRFGVPVGLSDHTLEFAVPTAAVALGASVIEKHFTLRRAAGGPDAAFSLEPDEFRAMAQAVRTVEAALGTVRYEPTGNEMTERRFRRSLFVSRDMRAGDVYTEQNVKSVRPAHGLPPRFLDSVLGCRATRDIARGTPLSWELVDRSRREPRS